MFGFGISEIIFISPILILLVLPFWKIFSKAGFSGWWSLSVLLPIINLLAIYILAFSKWPIYKRMSEIDNIDKDSKTGSGNTKIVNFNEEDKPSW